MITKVINICLLSLTVTGVAVSDIWYDPTGDIATGNPNLDITSFEVTDNGADMSMTLTLANLDSDWGNYVIFMNIPGATEWGWTGSSDDNDNPWGRDISGTSGTHLFLGSWLNNGGGFNYYEHDGTGWGNYGQYHEIQMSIDWANNSITWVYEGIVASLTDGNYIESEGINFEVGTTGGNWGDPAIDLLGGEGTQPGWGQGSQSTDWNYYQFSTVPAPGALALLVLAGLGRRRRS